MSFQTISVLEPIHTRTPFGFTLVATENQPVVAECYRMLVITAIIDSITPFDWQGFVQDFLEPIRLFWYQEPVSTTNTELVEGLGDAPSQ